MKGPRLLMAPQIYQTQRSCRQDTVSIAGALLPMGIMDPFGFWKLYKDNKSCFYFTVEAMFKSKGKNISIKVNCFS